MISDLSSFIEFMAAVYVSMILDTQITRNFWTPNIQRAITDVVISLKDPQKQELFSEIISRTQEGIKLSSQKKGTYMVISCVFLLIYCGFETSMSDELLIWLIPNIGILLFGKWFLRKWKYIVFIHIFLASLFMFAAFNIFPAYLSDFVIPSIYLSGVIVIFLLCPILWHLFYNWIYSSVYVGYLRDVSKKGRGGNHNQGNNTLEAFLEEVKPSVFRLSVSLCKHKYRQLNEWLKR